MPEAASRHLSLEQLHRQFSTETYTIVVHGGSVQHRRDFPHAFVVNPEVGPFVNLPADPALHDLALVGSNSFDLAVCADVLERVLDPARVIGDIRRILRPGGRLILSVAGAGVFDARDEDLVRFTASGVRALLRDWSAIELLAGSSGPFGATSAALRHLSTTGRLAAAVRPLALVYSSVLPIFDWGLRPSPQVQDGARVRMSGLLHAVATK